MDAFKSFIIFLFFLYGSATLAAGPVDINTADKAALMAVKGVGESRAEAIISYREKYGPFTRIEDLMEVDGIGLRTLEDNRDILIVTEK